MNRSYSKIRHIQESNMKLENRRLVEQLQTTHVTGEESKKPLKQQLEEIYGVFANKVYGKKGYFKIEEIGEPGGAYGQYGGAKLTINKDYDMRISFSCSGPADANKPPIYVNTTGNEVVINKYFPAPADETGTSKNNQLGQGMAASMCKAINDFYSQNKS